VRTRKLLVPPNAPTSNISRHRPRCAFPLVADGEVPVGTTTKSAKATPCSSGIAAEIALRVAALRGRSRVHIPDHWIADCCGCAASGHAAGAAKRAKYQIEAMACPMVAIAKRTTISGAVTISAPFRPWRRRQETEVRDVLLAAHRLTRYAPVQYTSLAGRSEEAGGCTTVGAFEILRITDRAMRQATAARSR
jgi:hypothetical protein